MENLERLLQLPYQTLAILVGGYLAYRLAYVGRDGTHQTIDTIAITLVFAFVAQASSAGILLLCQWAGLSPVQAQVPIWAGYAVAFGGIVSAVVAGAIWRQLSVTTVPDFLRRSGVVSSDRNVAAWQTIINNEKAGPSTITVMKKSGEMLMCERLADYETAPFGPVILGQDGSVALYVTSSKAKGSTEWVEIEPAYLDWGPEITIIPADEISETRIRHNPSIRRTKRPEKDLVQAAATE